MSAAPTIKDYPEFTKYWAAHPDQREVVFQKYPDWGLHWMTDDTTRITTLYQEDPKLFNQLVSIRPYLLNLWLKRDNVTAKKWFTSEETHAYIKNNPRLLSKSEDLLTNDLLMRWPDLFIPYFRSDVVLASVWTARNPQVLQSLYERDANVRAFVDAIPELKAQLPVSAHRLL